jgi:transposase
MGRKRPLRITDTLSRVDPKDSTLGAIRFKAAFGEAALGVMDRLVLTDAAWERMAPLIIGRPDQKGSTGRDNRMFVEGVLWIVRTGSPWRDLPEASGDWNSVFGRFSRWSLKGVWWRIFEGMFDDPEFEYLIVDSTIVRAHQHAAGAKKGGLPEDQAIARSRGGLSTKIHMAVRGLGCPVRFTLTAGQRGDGPQAAAAIEGLPAEVVMADTAYDADHLRHVIAAKGALAVIRRTRRVRSNTSLRPATARRMLLLKTQAVPPRRNLFREDRPKLLGSRNNRRNRPVDAIAVHTT